MDSFVEPAPLARGAAGGHALGALFARVAAVALSGVLAACGGGGGVDPPTPAPPPPAPAPSPAPTAPIAAQLTVPTPVGYDVDRLAAFDRLNAIRLSAGLGMVAQSPLMDQAAQAHADWMIANDSFTHEEQQGTPGFTGIDWAQREEAFGYSPVSGAEVMSAGAAAAMGVDALVNMLYHRSAILAFEPVDVGVGWTARVATGFSKPLVIDLTRPGTDPARGLGQAAQAEIHGVAIWPLEGAHDVPLRLGLEIPNPVPSQDVLSLGTPASVTVGETKSITVTSFVLTTSTTGAIVPVCILTSQDDPNFIVPASFVGLIPLSALAPGTTYQVVFSGSAVDRLSGAFQSIERTWSFTTAAR